MQRRTFLSALAALPALTGGAAMADADLSARLTGDMRPGGPLEGVHSVLVLRDGAVMAEAYATAPDEAWGRDLGQVVHGPDTLHDIRSVTKVITGLLYGIALRDGLVPPPEAPLYAQFPRHADLLTEQTETITVGHVLTMTAGWAWDEAGPYTDARNSEIAMEAAPDRLRFVLEQPLAHPPGTQFTYSGGASTVLGALIEVGTGQRLDAYARAVLFDPLGIDAWVWQGRTEAEPAAASGLRLTARDLARIGEMLRQGGVHDGVQIVPAEWIDRAAQPMIDLGDLDYGYNVFVAPAFFGGFGNGGQRFTVNRDLGLVFVTFAGLYNQPDAWQAPLVVSRDYLGPELQRLGLVD